MLSSTQPSPFLTSSAIYRGARLAAGIGDPALAAELLGLTEAEYTGFESGYFPDLETKQHMARVFGVSPAYFGGKSLVTQREKLAHLISDGLARFEASLPIVGSTNFIARRLATSLVAMRQFFADFETPAEAAEHMGWNVLQYLAHEQGARPLSLDQFIIYALEYELRPDLALLGEPPAPLWEDAGYPWWQQQFPDDHEPTGAMSGPNFDWLRLGTSGGSLLSLPLVEVVDGAWTLGEKPLPFPRMLLPVTTAFVGDTLYGVTVRLEDRVRVVIVDPTRCGCKKVSVNGEGMLQINHDQPASDVVDPTHHRPVTLQEFFCVGAYVASIETVATYDE